VLYYSNNNSINNYLSFNNKVIVNNLKLSLIVYDIFLFKQYRYSYINIRDDLILFDNLLKIILYKSNLHTNLAKLNNIILYRPVIHRITNLINTILFTLLIKDLEHYLGTPVCLRISSLNIMQFDIKIRVFLFKLLNNIKVIYNNLEIDAQLLSFCLITAGYLSDIDALLRSFCEIFENNSYKESLKIYHGFINMLSYTYTFYVNFCDCVGIKFRMSGKFSKQLSVKSTVNYFSLGVSQTNNTNYGLLYRYKQC
jgi:hypothetical protein